MPEATPFQVMIVDDHPLMRRGVRQLLELDPGFEVVAEAGDGASAIDLANRLDIDVILLDLNMKGMSGLDTLNALRRDGVTAQIIILTVSDASSDVFALIDAGADGYLLKDSDPEVLLEAIRAGAKGSKVLMNPLMILVKIIKLRWIHILSYDQMVSRKINNQTTRCANSI
ncbi:response regulator, partial [Escherichia coli]|uniref:response regulator n=1 Tax=Escherichia coli TaxID=562 RepID=UPI00207D341B